MSSGLCPNCEECTFPGCGEDPNFHYGVNCLEDREVLASEGFHQILRQNSLGLTDVYVYRNPLPLPET